ncbi:MAG: L,D-transpeptidase [Luteolibacter sp.]|uniref:L,D-transpeptidase n=1 Tax=Luteolibacter sp. TaxID=1962973 RepID=UPI0032672161
MLRLVSSAFLALATLAAAQQEPRPATPPPIRTVLRALPLGGDEDLNSRPHPEESAIPAAPALTAPATPQAVPMQSTAIPSPLDVKPTGDDALRLQIYLDEAKFGPGIIDAKPGRFTELAVQSWNEVHGHPTEDWVAANTAARKAVPNPLAVAVVPDIVKDWVDGTLPTKVSLQAKRKRMSYRSVAEFMSERYHCDVPYLVELNGSSKINNLKARDTIIVPNVTPFNIEVLTGAGYKADESMSQRHAVVDTKLNQVRIFEAAPAALVIAEPGATSISHASRPNHGLIASFPITPGENKFIKFGTWEVRNSVELPHWRYDQQLLDTGKRSADSESLEIPPGPNSPVGVFWCGLSKPGIGLHGTPNPETIGRARSHGCIRMANWDAVRLPTLIRPGTTVEIR